MVELDNFKTVLGTYRAPLIEVRDALDLINKQQKIQELEREMEAPDFWNDPSVSQKKMQTLKSMKDDVATYSQLERGFEDIETMIEMGYEENDASLIPEIQEMLDDFVETYEAIRMKTLLSGEYDSKKAIVSLHAGAGGTESCDWAAMLFRMYSRWADKKGFTLTVLDSLDGEEAGIKSITFEVNGENAYGYLKSEKGVHRLVRISPFNAAGKRQTSFVSCDVMPDIEDNIDIEIKDEDYALWYRDVTEEPQKYEGKTIHFKAQVAMLRRDRNAMFAPGRFVMTCCVDDIQFCGLPCKYAASKELQSRSWVMVEATIAAEKHRLYKGDLGPVLTAISVTPAAPAVEDVCTF